MLGPGLTRRCAGGQPVPDPGASSRLARALNSLCRSCLLRPPVPPAASAAARKAAPPIYCPRRPPHIATQPQPTTSPAGKSVVSPQLNRSRTDPAPRTCWGGKEKPIEMGRVPCCEKDNVKRGQWTPEEDNKLLSYITQYGTRNWRLIPKNAGLQRCGKSCRLRWTNYLRPDLKHGEFTDAEEQTIIKLHSVVGNRWSVIAAQLPGRTDNDVKNHWNTKLKKKLSGMGIDPVTHKSFSHLMAEIATTLAPPQVAHLAEAALGCFKDEMLHLLTKKRPTDFPSPAAVPHDMPSSCFPAAPPQAVDDTVERIKLGLSRAIMSDPAAAADKQQPPPSWAPADMSDGLAGMYAAYDPAQAQDEFRYDGAVSEYVLGDGGAEQGTSMWSHQSIYSGSSGTEAPRPAASALPEKGNDSVGSSRGEDEMDDAKEGGKGGGGSDISGLFVSDCALWDLPDELTNHMV